MYKDPSKAPWLQIGHSNYRGSLRGMGLGKCLSHFLKLVLC